jgi:hypothetical protein
MNWIERPSALLRRKFSMIWGEKTTTQQAIDMELGGGQRVSLATRRREKGVLHTRRYPRWPRRRGSGARSVAPLSGAIRIAES